MHPELTPKPAMRIEGTPTSKGYHTKQSLSTSKGVEEQPIATHTQSRHFTPPSSPSNLQHDSPVASRTRSQLWSAHIISPARARTMAENHLAHHHKYLPVLYK